VNEQDLTELENFEALTENDLLELFINHPILGVFLTINLINKER